MPRKKPSPAAPGDNSLWADVRFLREKMVEVEKVIRHNEEREGRRIEAFSDLNEKVAEVLAGKYITQGSAAYSDLDKRIQSIEGEMTRKIAKTDRFVRGLEDDVGELKSALKKLLAGRISSRLRAARKEAARFVVRLRSL